MAKTTDLTITNGDDQFYPTPMELGAMMLAGVKMTDVKEVLEPSAGKGDLVKAISKGNYFTHAGHRYSGHAINVDCIEIDPHLREILKYEFSNDRLVEMKNRYRALEYCNYTSLNDTQKQERDMLVDEIQEFENCRVKIVHDDFFTFESRKHYDLIVMNPPFADGDKHLLRALEIQKHGGQIVCLLNAETIRNAYTPTRKLLLAKLNEYGASVKFVENAFASAERTAHVDCAIITVNIPRPDRDKSEFYERMKAANDEKVKASPELNALVAGDYMEQAVQMYNVEVEATLAFADAYYALQPYMSWSLNKQDGSILSLKVKDKAFDTNTYLRAVRMKYWEALFTNDEFTKRLTSELKAKFRKEVDKLADYEFTMFNIRQVMAEIQGSMVDSVDKAIMELFEKLTVTHSWYPECADNIHYFNGWKTNKAHKIGKKSIIPIHGIFSDYRWRGETFDVYESFKVISDIELALSYLDAEPMTGTGLRQVLEAASKGGQTRNIDCKYFKIDLFKKGTMHIKFKPEAMETVERLNIYAAQKKAWLPPNYGKTQYNDLTPEEAEVIDSFHGDGKQGSGAEKYAVIMSNPEQYMISTMQRAMLPSA